jgi:hypothetical protein
MLYDVHAIDWDTDIAPGLQRGFVVQKEEYTLEDGETMRTRWVADHAPRFVIAPDGWSDIIPKLPTLP